MKWRENSFLVCAAMTITYWVTILFGPFAVMAVNALNNFLTGTGYEKGSFFFEILSFAAQPISCIVASLLAQEIGKNRHHMCSIVNSVVATVILVIFALFGGKWNKILCFALSAVACIVAAYSATKDMKEKSESDEQLK